jgi:uncharacterized protein
VPQHSSAWLTADPADVERWRRPVRWGLTDVVVGLFVAQLTATVGGVLILVATGHTGEDGLDTAPLAVLFLLQLPLWLGYLGWTWFTSRTKGHGIGDDFGLHATARDAVVGLAAGIGTQMVLVPLLYIPILLLWSDQDPGAVAQDLVDRAAGPLDAVVLVVLVVVCAPIIEEIFYRGLVLRSFENKLGTGWAVALSALLFGAIHLQLLQFPALALFGVVTALLTVRTRRLGPAIWAHVGFNATTVAVLLSSA